MARIEQVIEVNVPLKQVYEKLTRFEEFPRFMQGVRSVRQLDDTHLHWRAEINGRETEWDAEITAQETNRHIAWRNTSGPKSEGKVSFEVMTPHSTRVILVMDADEAALRHPDMKKSKTPHDDHDLARFKKMIEEEQQSSAAGSEGGDIADLGESAAAYSSQTGRQTEGTAAAGASVAEAQPAQKENQTTRQEPRVDNDTAASSVRAGRRNIDREVRTAGNEQQRSEQKSSEQKSSKDDRTKSEESSTVSSAAPAFPSFLQAWEDPFRLMRKMSEDMEEFFGRWSARSINPWLPGRSATALRDWTPPLDIAQHGSQWVVCADLPGIKKEDVQVEINGGLLTITGERHADQTQVRQSSRRSERYHGYFYRAIDLPEGVDPEAAQASMHDGVLEITLPVQAHAQAAKGRRVDIQPSGRQ